MTKKKILGNDTNVSGNRLKNAQETMKRVKTMDALAGADSYNNHFVIDNEIFLDPIVIDESDELDVAAEQCGQTGDSMFVVPRPKWILMEYTDTNGDRVRQKLEGMKARKAGHEYDHLQVSEEHPHGITVVDRGVAVPISFMPEDQKKSLLDGNTKRNKRLPKDQREALKKLAESPNPVR